MPRCVTFFASGLLVVLSACAAAQDTTPARLPVPDAAALERGTATVKEVYGAKQQAAKTRTAKLELARRLVRDAIDTPDDPAAQLVMFRAALTIAVTQVDVPMAMEACQAMETRFQISNAHLEPLRELIAKRATGAGAAADQQVAACIERDDYASALEYLKVVETAARGDATLLNTVQAKRKGLEQLLAEHAAIKQHEKTLAADALDPAANLAMGRFLCLRKSNWDLGLSYLATSKDPDLSKLAEAELLGAADSAAQLKLADSWWTYALRAPEGDQKALKQRGSYWYARALSSITGADETRAKARLAEVPAPALPHYLELANPDDFLFRDWTGERWSRDARARMKIEQKDGKWFLESAYPNGWMNRLFLLRGVDPRTKKLTIKLKVHEGRARVAVRPLNESDDRYAETNEIRKGETALLQMFVRDNQVHTVLDGVASKQGDPLKTEDPLAYSIIVFRSSLVEIESMSFE